MSTIKVDTNSLQTSINNIDATKKYYAGKVSTFSGSYGVGNIGGYLSKIQNNYRGIANNLDNVIKYINEYISDIEEIEKNVDIGKVSNISTRSLKSNESSIIKNSISGTVLFDLGLPGNGREYNYREAYNDLLGLKNYEEEGKWWATGATCGLSFMEGMGNVVEGLVDGGCWVASGACSIFGFDEAAESIGEFVEKDISKDLYYDAVRATGLDRYADPNSTAANIASFGGNIVGNVLLSYGTGAGIAKIFGVGTKGASFANTIFSAGRQALSDSGSGMETALQRGGSLREAQIAGGLDALTGAVTGAASGRLDAAARGAGAAGDIWKVLGYSTGSGGISAMEPVINEATHTAIYHQDYSKSYWENFKSNFVNDGVISQIAMSGGMGSLGTLANGLRQLRVRNKVDLDDTAPMPKVDLDATGPIPKVNTIANDRNKRIYNAPPRPKVDLTAEKLKNSIIASTSNYTDPMEKLRALYIELNKHLHYDMGYVKGSSSERDMILSKSITFSNMNDDNTIVCKGWSELFRELLLDSGFSEDDVKIIKTGENGHRWVTIDNGDKFIIADATEAINRESIDLATCKSGTQTKGFLTLPKELVDSKPELKRLRISSIFSMNDENLRKAYNLSQEDLKTIYDLSQKDLRTLDGSVGYMGKNGYYDEQLSLSKKLFSNSDLVNKLLKRNPTRDIIEQVVDLDIPENMDGYEAYTYYKKVLNSALGKENVEKNVGFVTMYYKAEDGFVEPVFNMYLKDSAVSPDGFNNYIYSRSLGKIKFKNGYETNEFMRNFNLI